MKSREVHNIRALLSCRKALLNKTINLANEVRGVLKIFGLRSPKTVQHGSFDNLVCPLVEADEVLAHAMLPLLDASLVIYRHFLDLDRRVKRADRSVKFCLRMMTVPGVGPITALTFKAVIDDPARFKNPVPLPRILAGHHEGINQASATTRVEFHDQAIEMFAQLCTRLQMHY